ncbi:MAG: hypothetical protein J0H82_06200 [Alphaproteobacteria bacterium]|nr:hypothetical protein [Alphaproteobacteria bacterium]
MDERDRISGQIAEIDRRLAAGTSVTGALDTPLDPNAPTPERLAKGDVYQGKHHIVDETEPTKVRENFTGYRSQAAIDHYLACGIIDETQWRAGDMLRADYFRAEMVRGVTASYAEPTGPGDGDAALEVVAARTSLAGAMSAVGPALSGVVVHVVCLGQTAKSWSEQNGRKGRQAETEGMALLKAGLFNLAVYYGLVAAPEPAIDRAARISSGPDVDAPTAKPASPLEPQFLMVPHAGRDGRKVLSVAKSAG